MTIQNYGYLFAAHVTDNTTGQSEGKTKIVDMHASLPMKASTGDM